jgi:glyoxylase-like metal-dependent hydrolase (beta-lactamase superfamily II)
VQLRTVGAFEENTYLAVDETTNRAVLIDPGAEPETLIEMVNASGPCSTRSG